ncbi:unnamed protein product, partial [Mesorhabditis spiculigera]
MWVDPNRTADVRCRARRVFGCYKYIHPLKAEPLEWFAVEGTVTVDCDFVKSECFKKGGTGEASVEHWMHTQIVENNKSTVPQKKPPVKSARPDVFMFVFDSVSSTQARRSLPRSLSFLETKFGGRHFHHLNKVGDNTRPNAYAMFLGWRIYAIRRDSVGGVNADSDHPDVCKYARDNDSVIFREYEKIGYKTMYSEDYGSGTAFSWNCKGFKNQEANHLFR